MKIKSALETTRPSPGPGFEHRAVAAALVRVRHNRRTSIAGATGFAAVAAAAAIALVIASSRVTDGVERVEQTPAPTKPAPTDQPAPAGPVSHEAARIAAGPAPASDSYDELEIPPAKRDLVDRVVLDLRKREIKLTAEIEIAQLELAHALSASRLDRALIAKRVMKKARLVGQLESARTLAWADIRQSVGDLAKLSGARRPRTPARPTIQPVVPTGTGTLTINAKPYSVVFIDGRRVGVTPIHKTELRAGHHRVKLIQNDSSATKSFNIKITAGQETRRTVLWEPTDLPLE